MLAFSHRQGHLCLAKKDKSMCTIEKKFERFGRWLLRGAASRERCPSYEQVCLRLRVSPASLSAYTQKELGMDGPEILYCFQNLLDL